MSEKVFRKRVSERISSPEQLNDYIKVSNPSIWIILGAVFALAAAVVVSSITGSLPSIVTAYGVAGENQIVCGLCPAGGGGRSQDRHGSQGRRFEGQNNPGRRGPAVLPGGGC